VCVGARVNHGLVLNVYSGGVAQLNLNKKAVAPSFAANAFGERGPEVRAKNNHVRKMTIERKP
jgi:hypothetical protein